MDHRQGAAVELVDCQYQYSDGENFMFIDADSFEQYGLPIASHEERGPYLKEGASYTIVIREGKPSDIEIPPKMVFTVVAAEDRRRGESFSGATKPVSTETGLVVRVPLFIKKGERILVDTRSNDFVERVSD